MDPLEIQKLVADGTIASRKLNVAQSVSRGMRIEITSIDELVAFVAIIRGEELDLQKIKELTKGLNKSTDALIKAENDFQKSGV